MKLSEYCVQRLNFIFVSNNDYYKIAVCKPQTTSFLQSSPWHGWSVPFCLGGPLWSAADYPQLLVWPAAHAWNSGRKACWGNRSWKQQAGIKVGVIMISGAPGRSQGRTLSSVHPGEGFWLALNPAVDQGLAPTVINNCDLGYASLQLTSLKIKQEQNMASRYFCSLSQQIKLRIFLYQDSNKVYWKWMVHAACFRAIKNEN